MLKNAPWHSTHSGYFRELEFHTVYLLVTGWSHLAQCPWFSFMSFMYQNCPVFKSWVVLQRIFVHLTSYRWHLGNFCCLVVLNNAVFMSIFKYCFKTLPSTLLDISTALNWLDHTKYCFFSFLRTHWVIFHSDYKLCITLLTLIIISTVNPFHHSLRLNWFVYIHLKYVFYI